MKRRQPHDGVGPLTLVVTVAALAATDPADAGTAHRVWVSGHGVDQPGCGAPTAPCRSLQFAHDNAVAAGGEIDILDPAGYGAVKITKAVSIVNDGVGTAGVQALGGGNAIEIDAGPNDYVDLRGLNVDGAGFAGDNGIVFYSGVQVTIENCFVRHFSNAGIRLTPISATMYAIVRDTVSSDNQQYGILFDPQPGASVIWGMFEHVEADNNQVGVEMISSIAGSSPVRLSAYDVTAVGNLNAGMSVSGNGEDQFSVQVDDSHFSNNGDGFVNQGAAVSALSHSVISQNVTNGIDNQSTSGGLIVTMGDNTVIQNFQDINGVMPTLQQHN